jgi:hypothetical protein
MGDQAICPPHRQFGDRPIPPERCRVDALVWAFTDLLVEPMAGEGIYELYRQPLRSSVNH